MKRYRNYLRISLGLLFMLAVSAAWAETAQFLYVGAAPVYSLTDFNWKNSDPQQTLNNDTTGNTQAEIFGGYGILIDRIYLGLEANTQLGDRTSKSQTRNPDTQALINNKIIMNDIYVVDFRPGYVMHGENTMLYGVLGINSADFTAMQQDESNNVIQNSSGIRETGLRIGLGYNLGVGHHVMARAEYVYTQFPNFSFSDTPADESQPSWSFHPSSHEFSFGLSTVIAI